MPKAKKGYNVPTAQKKRDIGVPSIQTHKLVGRQAMPYGKSKPIVNQDTPRTITSIQAIASSSKLLDEPEASSSSAALYEPVDASLTTRDSSAKAFMRELRKVVERSDVIIQVLDARDPEGTRSRWVEEEVRKRESQGKKLLGVVNKIDLVPRANLEAWLKHLRHSFPCMPFKSSTQSQRQNLSQNSVPIVQAPTAPGQPATLPPLPTTSSSLGAPALLHLLKQYSLSTPHSSLTVGVVGYPNVGKSSLINSLKRSRACAVAAMPGKTRVVQEVVLDKGVKIVDCPGVVLEDFGREMTGEEGRRRQAEIMLRNCVKAELVEDPIAPIEVIISKVDPAFLQKLYNIPPYDDVRDFLIKVALTRGRLGKGGIPDIPSSAVSVLRDWNSGKIPYFTAPPKIHPSSALAATTAAADVAMDGEPIVGDKILNTLSGAFSLDGLIDSMGDDAAWEGEEPIEEDIPLVSEVPVTQPVPPLMMIDPDSPLSDHIPLRPSQPISSAATTSALAVPLIPRHITSNSDTKLFTPEELATLPVGVLDRQKLKQQAKKAKRRRAEVEKTEGDLMLGFMDIGIGEREIEPELDLVRPSARKIKKAKKAAAKARQMQRPSEMEVDEEAKKEADFASFLANVGGDSDEEL